MKESVRNFIGGKSGGRGFWMKRVYLGERKLSNPRFGVVGGGLSSFLDDFLCFVGAEFGGFD